MSLKNECGEFLSIPTCFHWYLILRQNEFGPSDNLQSVARTNNDDEVSTLCNKRISVEYQSVITEDELAACYVSQTL